jgi:hypothetical protein
LQLAMWFLRRRLKCEMLTNIWWKKGNNSKMGIGTYFKTAGWVDLNMLHIFAIKLNLYLL